MPRRAGHRVVDARHGREQDRVVPADHREDRPGGGHLGRVFARTAARVADDVVGHDGRVTGVDELLRPPGHDAVLVDPVDPAVLDAHPHPGEVPAHLVRRVASARPAEGRGACRTARRRA